MAASWENDMSLGVRLLLSAVTWAAVTSAAVAQTPEPSWKPDQATVTAIEATLVLPTGQDSGPLKSYARYYKGLVQNGHRIIYGDLLRGRLAQEPPGLYLRDPPAVSTGGGCGQIQLWYDVDAQHMVQIRCYGLG